MTCQGHMVANLQCELFGLKRTWDGAICDIFAHVPGSRSPPTHWADLQSRHDRRYWHHPEFWKERNHQSLADRRLGLIVMPQWRQIGCPVVWHSHRQAVRWWRASMPNISKRQKSAFFEPQPDLTKRITWWWGWASLVMVVVRRMSMVGLIGS